MKRTKIMIISFIAAVLLFIIVNFVLDLNILFSVVVTIIFYLLIYGILSEASPLRSENIDENELLPYAKELYYTLLTASQKIKDEKMNSNVQQLVIVSRNVIEHIETYPEDTEFARYFITSYLYKIVQLIQRYIELENKSNNNVIINNSLKTIKEDIEIILIGFDNEYNNVMSRFIKDTLTISENITEQTHLDDPRSKYT